MTYLFVFNLSYVVLLFHLNKYEVSFESSESRNIWFYTYILKRIYTLKTEINFQKIESHQVFSSILRCFDILY